MFIQSSIGARNPGDDFWYGPAPGGVSVSGRTVTTETALRLSTVYKCVRVRAETVGMLPILLYRRIAGGGKEAVGDHPLYSLLHDRPNPWQTAMGWRQMLQAHLDLRGNAYAEIVYNGAGRVDMLLPRHPDAVTLEVMPNGVPRFKVRDAAGRERTLVWGEMLHIAGLTWDGYVGMNPIEAARDAIGAGLAARDYGSRYFANSARPPTWIKMPGKFATPEARRQWSNDFSVAFGGMNSGKTPIMEQGMELHALTVSNADAQFIESRKYSDIDIAGLFRMPPHKIGILDRATWGNIEHQQLDFVQDTILPSCVAWEQALLRDLPFDDGTFAEFKLSGLLRGDTRSRYEAYGKGIKDGWLTRNEARALENMNPLDGLDEPLEPLNMAPAGSRSEAPEDDDETEPEDDRAEAGGARRAVILQAAAERVARKELALWRAWHRGVQVTAEHGRWVREVLAVSDDAAAARVAALPGIFAASDPKMAEGDFIAERAAELIRLE